MPNEMIKAKVKELMEMVREQKGSASIHLVLEDGEGGLEGIGGSLFYPPRLEDLLKNEQTHPVARLAAFEHAADEIAMSSDKEVAFAVTVGGEVMFSFYQLPETCYLRTLIEETPDTPAYRPLYEFLEQNAERVNEAGALRDRVTLQAVLTEASRIYESIVSTSKVSQG